MPKYVLAATEAGGFRGGDYYGNENGCVGTEGAGAVHNRQDSASGGAERRRGVLAEEREWLREGGGEATFQMRLEPNCFCLRKDSRRGL